MSLYVILRKESPKNCTLHHLMLPICFDFNVPHSLLSRTISSGSSEFTLILRRRASSHDYILLAKHFQLKSEFDTISSKSISQTYQNYGYFLIWLVIDTGQKRSEEKVSKCFLGVTTSGFHKKQDKQKWTKLCSGRSCKAAWFDKMYIRRNRTYFSRRLEPVFFNTWMWFCLSVAPCKPAAFCQSIVSTTTAYRRTLLFLLT